jgi:hypothetical protein
LIAMRAAGGGSRPLTKELVMRHAQLIGSIAVAVAVGATAVMVGMAGTARAATAPEVCQLLGQAAPGSARNMLAGALGIDVASLNDATVGC